MTVSYPFLVCRPYTIVAAESAVVEIEHRKNGQGAPKNGKPFSPFASPTDKHRAYSRESRTTLATIAMNSIPSYADSQLEFITRIQPRPTLCKSSLSPSPSTATSTAPRTVTASSQYRRRRRVDSPSEWSFSGWGRIVHEQLLPSDYSRCLPEESASCARREELRDEKKSGGDASKGNGDDERVLGKWLGSSISGIAVAGSPFYAFPAVVAVASVL